MQLLENQKPSAVFTIDCNLKLAASINHAFLVMWYFAFMLCCCCSGNFFTQEMFSEMLFQWKLWSHSWDSHFFSSWYLWPDFLSHVLFRVRVQQQRFVLLIISFTVLWCFLKFLLSLLQVLVAMSIPIELSIPSRSTFIFLGDIKILQNYVFYSSKLQQQSSYFICKIFSNASINTQKSTEGHLQKHQVT